MKADNVGLAPELDPPIILIAKTSGQGWLCRALLIFLLTPTLLLAQGFPGSAFAPGERVMTLPDGDGRKSRVAYHQGYLYTADQDRQMIRLWDIANANNPFIVRTFDNVGGSHAYGRMGDVIAFWSNAAFRATEPDNPQRFTLAQSLGSGREFYYPWMLTHHDGYGSPGGTLLIGDARTGEVFSNPDPLGDVGVAGKSILIGNLLIYASLHSTSGIATYDVSDPRNPILLDSIADIGAYEPAVFGHLLTLAVGRNNQDLHQGGNFNRGITIVDFSDPRDLRVVATISTDDLSGDHRYMQFQDQYMFVGTNKVDMNSLQVVQQFADAGGGSVDFLLPIGHLVALGQRVNGDVEIFAHQSGLDTRAPTVAYHLPADGATNQALTGRIGVIIHETLDTSTLVSKDTFIVRPVGGAAIDGVLFANDMDIVTFTPEQALLPDTTYEVVLPAGGIEDVAGNAIAGYSFRFSTGADVVDDNQAPVVDDLTVSSYPAAVGQSVELDVVASDADGDRLEFRFDFGDGTPQTDWVSTPSATHSYTDEGHYRAQAQVRDTQGAAVVRSLVVTVIDPPTATGSTNSGPILVDEANRLVWVVNPDNDSVTAVDADSLQVVFETPVGADPRSLAQAPDGSVWVACQDADRVDVLDGNTGSKIEEIALSYGSAPHGIVFAPDGATGYASLQGSGELIELDPDSRSVTNSIQLGPRPRALAVSDDGSRILVTRFISSSTRGEVWEVDAASFTLANTITLAKDPGPDSASSGRGVPNYVAGITISPDGRRAWVASKKDNVDRGSFNEGADLTFETTVRTILSKIDPDAGNEVLAERIDSDNNDSLVAVEFSPLGDYAFAAVQGNNRIEIIDAFDNTRVTQIASGRAPQGMRFDSPSGQLFIKDFMSRTVTVYEARDFLQRGDIAFAEPITVATVSDEQLDPQVLQGKQIFYNAEDARMSRDGYLSCASCHVDGDTDGQVWDFTGRGEGLRNTIALRGKGGPGHGPLHWSANFDEVQDFENDIRNAFGGGGFMDDAAFNSGTRSDPLGDTKAGQSRELDALAAYVTSLTEFGRSPYRNSDGTLTDAALAGEQILRDLNCTQCHDSEAFSDSGAGTLHDVGTLKASSGQRNGAQLTGLDTPTLRGLWETAPYLHDGSAATVLDVITTENADDLHGETSALTALEQQQLVAYLLQIDDDEPPATPAAPPTPRAGELVDNGSFEQDLAGWQTELSGGGDATWRPDSSENTAGQQSLRAEVLAIDGTDWHVQFFQGGRSLVGGETYRISFDVKASNTGVIRTNVMQNHDPWQNLGFRQEVAVAQDWQRYTFDFVASGTDSEARLSFILGGEGPRTLWFDNISFEGVSSPPPPQACRACGGDCDNCGGNRTVWVDQQNGDNANRGFSATEAVTTIARGAQIIRGGDVMVVRPGTYYEKPSFQNLGSSASAPVWILSEIPGEAVISGLWKAAAEGTQSWQSRGNGVYSANHGDAYTGSYNDAFLFHYNSLSPSLVISHPHGNDAIHLCQATSRHA